MVYKTSQHGVLLAGEVRISPGSDANTGILCQCCKAVISCSKFEAHAGQGSRRYLLGIPDVGQYHVQRSGG